MAGDGNKQEFDVVATQGDQPDLVDIRPVTERAVRLFASVGFRQDGVTQISPTELYKILSWLVGYGMSLEAVPPVSVTVPALAEYVRPPAARTDSEDSIDYDELIRQFALVPRTWVGGLLVELIREVVWLSIFRDGDALRSFIDRAVVKAEQSRPEQYGDDR